MRPGWCLICGSNKRRDFARTAAGRVTGPPGDAPSVFVICPDCGHVYQDPMPEDADRGGLPGRDGSRCGRDGEEAERGRERDRRLCDELAPLVESLTPGRRVLCIGGGSASLLAAFQARGWEVFGRAEAFRGQTFSLILFCHAIEQLSDPLPKLRAMRRHLDVDGVLFVATPNLVNPPPAAGPFPGLLAGDPVRLYSPGALRTVLARSGFRSRPELYERPGFGMGMLAQLPRGRTQPATEGPADDAAAITELFLASQRWDVAGPFGRNLAGLLQSQPSILPALCRKADAQERLRVTHWGETVVAIAGVTAAGQEVPLVSWEGPGEGRAEPIGRVPADARTVVLLGLGSGAEARSLARRLAPSQRLLIWETDLALARAVLKVTDLSELWTSGQATLLLGERPLHAIPPPPVAVYRTEAARHWDHSIYQRIADRLLDPARSPHAGGRRAGSRITLREGVTS